MDFNLSPYLFQIGNFGIRYYSLVYLFGMIAGYFWLIKFSKYDKDKIADFALYGFLVVILGARLGFVLFYEPQWIWKDPLEIFKIWQGGMSFHGGFIAIVLWILYYARKQKWNFWEVTDAIAVPLIFIIGLGRIGNFMNGELWGRVTDVAWCFNVEGWEGCRHPSQLYQALANFITFGILCFSYFKIKRVGVTGGLFVLLYGISRSLIETLWREPTWVFWGITAGTWLSVPMIFIGLILIKLALKRSKKGRAQS